MRVRLGDRGVGILRHLIRGSIVRNEQGKRLRSLMKNKKRRLFIGMILEEEFAKILGEGALIRDILKWIAEHPEEFKAIIDMIIGLFA